MVGIGIVELWNFELVDEGEITVGRASLTRFLSANSCISSCSLMFPARSSVLAGLVGEF